VLELDEGAGSGLTEARELGLMVGGGSARVIAGSGLGMTAACAGALRRCHTEGGRWHMQGRSMSSHKGSPRWENLTAFRHRVELLWSKAASELHERGPKDNHHSEGHPMV
jgi:hypothetical protein